MILPPNTVSAPRGRALATRKPIRVQPGRQATVRVNALFGMGGPSSGGNNEAVLELVNSKFSGPSEAGNAQVADSVASFGRVNKNPRTKDLYGEWGIVYASGNTGLTALDGKIAKFRITDDGQYENECTSKIAGIFPGSAKEGGQLKVTGGNKFELLQDYREYSRPGASSYEEVEDAPIRSFEVLALTDSALVIRLAATTFLDEDSGRKVTQVPEGDYYLVWRKVGAATAAVAAVQADSDVEDDDEEVQPASGSIFSGIFGGKKVASLATVAEKNISGGVSAGSGRSQALQAQQVAAQAKQQAALDRKAAAQADRERRAKEAEARKQEQKLRAQQAQQDVVGDGTEVVTKPLFAFGGFGGKSSKVPKEEDVVEKTTGVAVKGLGSLFGSQNSKKRESAAAKTPATDPAAQRRQEADARKQEAAAARERAKQEQAAKAEQARLEREQKAREAQAKKQEEAQKRQEEATMRQRINDVLSEMQNDARDAALEVREQATQLRTAERTGASATRAGAQASRQLEAAEAEFSKAESQLADANDVFNDIADKLRAKQAEVNAARNEARQLENNLLKKV